MKRIDKKKGMFAIGTVLVIAVGMIAYNVLGKKETQTYDTTAVERGMIISSISGSGQIVSSSNIPVTTQASGIIKKIYVKEGDVVKEGDTILTLQLDRAGKLSKTKAWANYLSAKSALKTAAQGDLIAERDVMAAEIDLASARQSKLSAQRELTLAKSSLIASEDAWENVKSQPETNSERQQKELALQAAQHAVELAQSKVDNADKNNELSVEQNSLTLKKELVTARLSRDAAQAAYDAALESTPTPDAELKQREASLVSAQQAVELAQYKYDHADDTNELTAEQTKLSLQRELDSARASLAAAEDAWNVVKNRPESDADRRQAELALQAAKDAVEMAQGKYDLVGANIAKANLGVSIAKQKGSSDSSAIEKAKADVDAAWYSYQETLPTVTAPVSGKITDINLIVGGVISSSSSSSSSASSSSNSANASSGSNSSASGNSSGQTVATIAMSNVPMATFSISEVDIVKVKTGLKASITADALSDKTFTGKVVSIDRNGSSSSGVTTYPATIMFDTEVEGLLPNMAVTANIITETKDNVLLIPSGLSTTVNGQTVVTVLKNGVTQQVTVELGISSDSQVEVVSGLSEGDKLVSQTASSAQGSTGSGSRSGSSSPFSGGMGGMGGMGAMGGPPSGGVMRSGNGSR